MKKLSNAVLTETVLAVRQHGTQVAAAKALGLGIARISERIKEATARGLFREEGGRLEVFEAKVEDLPRPGKKKVYILTSAQNYTKLHACWYDLLALADHDHATLLCSTFKYNKDAMGQRAAAKWETREAELRAEYPAEIIEYICNDRIDLTPNLTFCGELNVLPTAQNPLEGLESYTYRKSTIVPHPKLALQSVASMPGEGVKLMYTTGCVTRRNYIKRKVGFKAESFHSYGALLVEVDEHGSWWCRQLQVGNDGAIYDLDRKVKGGVVTTGHHIEAITWGDTHVAKGDPRVAKASWGTDKNSILEFLHPRLHFVHDVLDFGGRSHHTRKDPHAVYSSFVNGDWELTQELKATAKELWYNIARDWCQTIVVNSNHDRHIERWLKEMDWRDDPANARMILQLNLNWLNAIDSGRALNMPAEALQYGLGLLRANDALDKPPDVRFLNEDESYVILPKIDGGIEGGLHGDRGSNGAKGTISGIAGLDRKVNGADKHTQAIMNHAYFAGTSAMLDMGFNHGLTSWTNAHIITYPNATRAILAMWKGKWRA